MTVAFRQYRDQHVQRHDEPVRVHAGGAVRVTRHAAPGGGVQQHQAYVPPGWPEAVPPPGVPDWEQAAVAWLLDQCPADYRGYPVLRRHPVVLARLAVDFVDSQVEASRRAVARARPSLSGHVDPWVLDEAVEAIQAEGARLVRVRRAAALVDEALRGAAFLRKL